LNPNCLWQFSGSPTARKYSRNAREAQPRFISPYFLRARQRKQLSTVFSLLTRLSHQKGKSKDLPFFMVRIKRAFGYEAPLLARNKGKKGNSLYFSCFFHIVTV